MFFIEFGSRGGQLHLLGADARIEAVIGVAGRNHRQPADAFGMLHGEAEGRPAAEGIAEHVDLAVAELFQDCRQVVADGDEIDVALAERGAAMTVQVDGDHLPVPGERRQRGPEHVDRAQPAVEQQQRLAAAADLVIVVDPVGFYVTALLGLGCCGRGDGRRRLFGMAPTCRRKRDGRGENCYERPF